MPVKCQIRTSEYHDSVSLMLIAKELTKIQDVVDAAVVMGTEANKSILKDAGLFTAEIASASPNDLIITINATESAATKAFSQLEKLLQNKQTNDNQNLFRPKTIRNAIKENPEANIAVISVAGQYAVNEAWEALHQGLHVLLFSDNVSLKDEVELKRFAASKGLLLMGPGAGTAIINGVALGFANVIPHGPIGIVSAAGTGLQEVSTLLVKNGTGITQGFGTGGRDLKEEVGGIMMSLCLQTLQEDPETEAIILISKPPSPVAAGKLISQATKSTKKTVICFLGQSNIEPPKTENMIMTRTLEEAAWEAAKIAGIPLADYSHKLLEEKQETLTQVQELSKSLNTEQKYVRGLFSGGTLCYEAQIILSDTLPDKIYSNAPLTPQEKLVDSTKSQFHSLIDLGEEEFTVGRPHPMIDNDLRIRRLTQEINDPEVAVILFDVVIGYGAHRNPAQELADAIHKGLSRKSNNQTSPVLIASVTGTDEDPQNLTKQINILKSAGVHICDSNAAAARLSARIILALS
jgi:FdrA protein